MMMNHSITSSYNLTNNEEQGGLPQQLLGSEIVAGNRSQMLHNRSNSKLTTVKETATEDGIANVGGSPVQKP